MARFTFGSYRCCNSQTADCIKFALGLSLANHVGLHGVRWPHDEYVTARGILQPFGRRRRFGCHIRCHVER